MPASKPVLMSAQIGAVCDYNGATGRHSLPLSISHVTTDGCSAIALEAWDREAEFVQLTIDGCVQINARILAHRGRQIEIAFYGQIHPCVVAKWTRAAA